MDLGTWDLKYYTPPQSFMVQMTLGAKRFRCEACRCNFVSFRKLKLKSTFRRRPAPLPTVDTETYRTPEDIEVS